MTSEDKFDHVFTLLVQSADRLVAMTPAELAETLAIAHQDAGEAFADVLDERNQNWSKLRDMRETLDRALTEHEYAQTFGWQDRDAQAWQLVAAAL